MLLKSIVGAWLALETMALVGCGCASDGAGAADGGVDADAPDAGWDAGYDAGGVRRRDAGPAASDAAKPDPAGWVPLEGLPEGCVIELSRHPEVLFSPEWTGCHDGTDGCLELAPDDRFERAVEGEDIGLHDGSAGYFGVVETWSDDPASHVIRLIARTDAPPVAAWRYPPYRGAEHGVCQLGLLGIGDGAAAVGTDVLGGAWVAQQRVLHGPLDSIGDVDHGLLLLQGTRARYAAPQHTAVSATTVAAEIEPGGFVMAVEGDTVETLPDPPAGLEGVAQNPHVIGRHVLWEAWGSQIRLLHGGIGRPTEVYRAVDGGDVRASASDGADLAWIEGYGRPCTYGCPEPYARVELWTAPYVPDPADLEPRKVRDLPQRIAKAVVGAGYYGHADFEEWHEIVLYRLSDGRRGTWTLPRDSGPGHILWITPDEIGISTGAHLYRVQLSALSWEPG